MTVGELQRMLSNFPDGMPVAAWMEQETPVLDPTGDRIIGQISGYFDIQTVEAGKEFVVGTGFLPIAVLGIGE